MRIVLVEVQSSVHLDLNRFLTLFSLHFDRRFMVF